MDGCGFAAVEDEIMARWLKVAVDTPYKQAIRNAARDCGCSRGDAFLAFFELYSWLDEQTDDGRLATDPAELNRWAGIPGFAESLSRSGWLTFRGDICEISNWGEKPCRNVHILPMRFAAVQPSPLASSMPLGVRQSPT